MRTLVPFTCLLLAAASASAESDREYFTVDAGDLVCELANRKGSDIELRLIFTATGYEGPRKYRGTREGLRLVGEIETEDHVSIPKQWTRGRTITNGELQLWALEKWRMRIFFARGEIEKSPSSAMLSVFSNDATHAYTGFCHGELSPRLLDYDK